MTPLHAQQPGEAAPELYCRFKQEFSSGEYTESIFDTFKNEDLYRKDIWFRALALWEYTFTHGWNKEKTESFFNKIFADYDSYIEFDLNEEEYSWYWETLLALLAQYAQQNVAGWYQLAMQYWTAKRINRSDEKCREYLEKAVTLGYEPALVRLGYFMYCGTLGEKDKERTEQLFGLVKTKGGLEQVRIMRAFAELWDGDLEIARKILSDLETTDLEERTQSNVYYLHAYIADIDRNYEEAITYYKKETDLIHHAYSFYRYACINLNHWIENPLPEEECIRIMERSFRMDPIRNTAETLYRYYYKENTRSEENDKIIYLFEKGAEYGLGYCAYQLSLIYLNDEEYKDIEKGLHYLDCSIELKYHSGWLAKAVYHRDGRFYEKDMDKCRQYLEEAVEHGCWYGWFHMGYLYETGMGTEDGSRDFTKALEYYEKAAEKEEVEACDKMGLYYFNGHGCEKDWVKAREWFAKAVSLGSDFSRIELGLMYVHGEGGDVDCDAGFKLFTEAMENNYSPGIYHTGTCYQKGWGTQEDPDKAFECFSKAAEKNHTWAITELGLCYERAYAVERDFVKALEYFERAAEHNYGFAQYKAGTYYMYGRDKVAVDYDKALEYFQKSDETNYPYAALELGNYYFYQYNGTNEREKSYPYYRKAAEKGIVNEGLGLCLQMGIGVEENDGEGFKYLLKASEDGYIRAMYYTGRCYYFSIGTKENFEEAFRWFNEGANYNNIFCLYYKGKMMVDGVGTEQQISEGVECVIKAAERGSRDAMFELANYYLVGKGVEADEDLSWNWFEKAAERGHKQAMKITGKSQRK